VVHGIVPDVAMARRWYEAAIKLGSAEANQRLELLASRNR
jgi:TPR repeat protein